MWNTYIVATFSLHAMARNKVPEWTKILILPLYVSLSTKEKGDVPELEHFYKCNNNAVPFVYFIHSCTKVPTYLYLLGIGIFTVYTIHTQVGKAVGHLKNIHVPNAVLRMNFPALVDIYDVMVNLLNQQEKSVTLNHHIKGMQ